MQLNFDPALVLDALEDMPVIETEAGPRPDLGRADIITAMPAPYIEFSKLIVAYARANSLDIPRAFSTPFPAPVIEPPYEFVGLTMPSHIFVIDLSTATLGHVIPSGPCLVVEVQRHGLVDAVPYERTTAPGRQLKVA